MKQKACSALMCFRIVAKFLGIQVPPQEEEDFLESNNPELQILLTAKKLNVKAYAGKIKAKRLYNISTPIIASTKDGEYFIVLKYQEGKFLILYPNRRQPEWVEEDSFISVWDGTAIWLTTKKVAGSVVEKFGFKWFIPTILKFKKAFIEVMLATFVIQIVGIMAPLMTQVVVDKVLSHNALSTLNTISIGIFIAYLYELIISLAKNFLFVHTTNRIDVTLSYRLMKHLFALPLKYFETRRTGETIARVREVDGIRSFLTGTPLSSLIDLIFVTVYIAILFMYDIPLTILVLASIPVFAILSIIVTPLFKNRLNEKFQAGAKTQSFLVESMNGIQTIKSFALEKHFESEWGDLQADYVKAGYRTSIISSTAGTVGSFIQRIFDLLILLFGAKAVLDGRFTVGELVAFRMLSARVGAPILRLVQLWQEYQQASLSVKRIGDIFNSPKEPASMMSIQTIPPIKGKIVFDNVSFRYRMDAPEVLHDISFEIEENTVIGIVGRSGCGKSTIAKLVERFYIPERGKISIDGMDISIMNPTVLRKQIGIVLQENFMFSKTVAENIAIHCKNASAEQIVEAAKIAGAHDFILELQEGYDTLIGEKGVLLSGGQKQRIAIARAIINNPRILIFDEATSALDYESESMIQRNLKKICQGRTVIMIAHRLSTLRDVDKIMVIDKGSVVEYDTQESLLEKEGLFYTLYHMQQRGETE